MRAYKTPIFAVMKLEYLGDLGDSGRPIGIESEQLVRLYDFNKVQAQKLRQAIQETIIDGDKSLELSELDFIERVNCDLVLRLADEDEGITTRDKTYFYCDLTVNGYREMLRLIEPFCQKESRAYQWLYELDTPIDFLFSARGSW